MRRHHHPMWISLPLARSLAGRFVRAATATALASAALVTVAALVEGHPPTAETLRAVVAPLAAALGACWALGGWRRAGEDVAAAALGWRGGLAPGAMALLALPLLALGDGGPSPAQAGPALAVEESRVVARLPGGAVEWRWLDDTIERHDAQGVASMPALPRPQIRGAVEEGEASLRPLRALGLRGAALVLGLLLLTLGAAPGPPRVVFAATAAFALGHGAVWLLGG